MTLKDTISKWHGATCLLEQDHPKEAMQRLMQIENPSAKIVYNLGCISMKMDLYTDAIEFFSASLEQDKYLAISYFQRGVCFYKIRSFSSAERDFEAAKSMIPSEGIDYRQLGAKVILQAKLIDGYSRLCKHYSETNMPSPIETSSMDFIFHPPRKMVANLKKEDFLGKAKVISSVEESDILYAESKGVKENTPRKTLAGVKSPLSASMLQLTPNKSTALPPSRPPPRLGKSHSMGNLCDGDLDNVDNVTDSSGASSLTVPTVLGNFHKRQSIGEYNYSHVPQEENSDSFSNYTRLSVSSPVLDQTPSSKKPAVPKRPVTGPREKMKKDNVSNNNNNHIKPPLSPRTGFEFQKIHEALKGKFSNGSDKNSQATKHQQPMGVGNIKPSEVNSTRKSREELDKLVAPKRFIAQSQPNLSKLSPGNDNPLSLRNVSGSSESLKPHKPGSTSTTAIKPNRPPLPAPRKSPDRTLDTERPTRPPRPPPPRKLT